MRKTVLALACVLLAPVFLVGITASAPYNPWNDLDADGDIDIFDVVKIAGTYGTTGDPGKNVNVTNWQPSYLAQTQPKNVSWEGYDAYPTLVANCGGFSRMYVYATVDSAMSGAYSVNVSMYALQWIQVGGSLPSYYEWTPDYLNFTADISGSAIYVPTQSIDDNHAINVKAPQCFLRFHIKSNLPSGWIDLHVATYLRNE